MFFVSSKMEIVRELFALAEASNSIKASFDKLSFKFVTLYCATFHSYHSTLTHLKTTFFLFKTIFDRLVERIVYVKI